MRWALLLLAVGCVRSNTVQCPDGRTCPFGTVCDDVHDRCVDAEQLETCDGMPNATPCTIDVLDDGVCREEVCLPLECGDEIRTEPEQCDGSDLTPGDDCTSVGYYEGRLTCNAACSYSVAECVGTCGDQIVQTDHELCDGAPPRQSCLDLGYGAGFLDCLGCGPDVADCQLFGWQQDVMPVQMIDVHGSSDANVFAVGGSVVMRFDGIGWDPVDLSSCGTLSTTFNAVWTLGNDTFVVGTNGVALHLTPTGCTKSVVDPAMPTVSDVWASSPTNVYATAGAAGVLRYDGTSWTKVSTVIRTRVWGSGPNDVWASGFNTVIHFDGSSWSGTTAPGAGLTQILSLWGTSPSDVYAGGGDSANGSGVVYRYNGASWTEVMREPAGGVLAGGAVAGRVFVSDVARNVRTFDGTVWTKVHANVINQYRALWVSSTGSVYALPASSMEVHIFNGNIRYDESVSIAGAAGQLAARSSAEMYAVTGTRNVFRFDGNAWSQEGVSSISDVWVDQSGAAYAVEAREDVATGTLYKRMASNDWQSIASYGGFRIWGASPTQIWTLDNPNPTPGGAVFQFWDGNSLTVRHTSTTSYFDLWGASSTSVFAVGDGILHFNGNTWSAMTSPTSNKLRGVSGSGPSDVYAVGVSGTVLRFDGIAWSTMPFPHPIDLETVWARGPDDVFVAGLGGFVYHYDGQRWSPVAAATNSTVFALDGAGDTVIWLEGSGVAHRLVRTVPW